MKTVKTYMLRKPSNIKEVLSKAEDYPPVYEVAEIIETIAMIYKKPFTSDPSNNPAINIKNDNNLPKEKILLFFL